MYTTHGWLIPGTDDGSPEPEIKADCGGPGPCPICNREVTDHYINSAKPAPRPRVVLGRLLDVVIQAMPWDGTAEGATPIINWMLDHDQTSTFDDQVPGNPTINIHRPDGWTSRAYTGSYIIKTPSGTFFAMTKDDFEAMYILINN